jgi:hypothetical protein
MPTIAPQIYSYVESLAVNGSTVYAGGSFIECGGQSRNAIAALDASSGLATSWNPNADGVPWTLAVSGSTVYAGGSFTQIGGQPRNHVAALDASTGLATTWNPSADGTVFSAVVGGSTVYVGGEFTHIGGQPRNYIAGLDASSGLATAWNPNASNSTGIATVRALAVKGTVIYAGGYFTSIGGQTRHRIAAINGDPLSPGFGAATTWDPNAAGFGGNYYAGVIYALAVSGNTVYAGGAFTAIGGQLRAALAGLDATTGLATDWDPNPNSTVLAIGVGGLDVYAGGYFNRMGGTLQSYIAAFTCAPTIGSALPAFGNYGSSVAIVGTNLNGATAIQFNGTNAAFAVNSSTSITATVPVGSTAGPIEVLTRAAMPRARNSSIRRAGPPAVCRSIEPRAIS